MALPYDTEALSSTRQPHGRGAVDDLVDQAGFADPCFPHQGDDLALPGSGLGERPL